MPLSGVPLSGTPASAAEDEVIPEEEPPLLDEEELEDELDDELEEELEDELEDEDEVDDEASPELPLEPPTSMGTVHPHTKAKKTPPTCPRVTMNHPCLRLPRIGTGTGNPSPDPEKRTLGWSGRNRRRCGATDVVDGKRARTWA